MLTIARVKQLLDDPTITDEVAERIRDGFHDLVADVIFPAWLEETDRQKNKHAKK